MSIFNANFAFQSSIPAAGWFIWSNYNRLDLANQDVTYLTTQDVSFQPFIQAFLIFYGTRTGIDCLRVNPRNAASMVGLSVGVIAHELITESVYRWNPPTTNLTDKYFNKSSYGLMATFTIPLMIGLRFFIKK